MSGRGAPVTLHVTIIAKAPVAGQVKTRLCPPCTPTQAAAVAAAALADTFAAVRAIAARTGARPLLLLDGEAQPWMPHDFDIVAQRGDGLEQRLANGFRDLGPGVIAGMETPHVIHHLADALVWLDRGYDAMGLAVDGGYWAIGLAAASTQRAAAVFDGVPMSRSDTGLAQLRRLHRLGRSVRMLPIARDLDDIDDLRAVAESGRPGTLCAVARDLPGAVS